MIGTVWRIGWMNLLRDRVALGLTFAVPIIFFSIFAAVFGAMDAQGLGVIDVRVVGESSPELARRLEHELDRSESLRVHPGEIGFSRDDALREIGARRASVAVVIPPEFETSLLEPTDDRASIELLVDGSNPMAARVVEAELRAAGGRLLIERMAAGSPPPVALLLRSLSDGTGVPIEIRDVVGRPGKRPAISYFAAGIGVMFLLFALCGRAAILIEERESGVLTRMLTSSVGLTRLLLGRWLYLASLGVVQVTVMFVWAAVAFGLDLWTGRHLAGFALMTVAASAAAAGMGLVLSVHCRTRAQLNGIAVVVVLVMSALGGGMFPRFLMPESLQRLGLLTFNAWALDGYQKIFWYESPLSALWPQLAVLWGLTGVFLVAARIVVGRRSVSA